MERKLLKTLRIKHKLTQQDLSEKLDISTIYVRKLEKGVANPGRETMIKYENFFETDMRKLFPDLFFEFDDKKCIKNHKQAI
ncbi:helix-turn-helix domain-containing protein [Lederbergia wuyishanensis]|uniref:Transcriptional regulator with XRE-family HTH domain n=1 Tax=Lederbergia wuyishanensis TaxID=1347903 RepID=A0ABU0D775_9BACI|nr:helix-turn-helix transcriptional regulator [Lederbergia wuyishanensis]MCJ8008939.1 helix-turn-helix transcriptional regulator [Lederbergia wuyishanensis]MDQ0344266.1 transcriptional regulator with XRE-family HTH domain [Lederbergia wuyishanensis]